jgi:hypothetical protein
VETEAESAKRKTHKGATRAIPEAQPLNMKTMTSDSADGLGERATGAPGKPCYAASVSDQRHAAVKEVKGISEPINRDAEVDLEEPADEVMPGVGVMPTEMMLDANMDRGRMSVVKTMDVMIAFMMTTFDMSLKSTAPKENEAETGAPVGGGLKPHLARAFGVHLRQTGRRPQGGMTFCRPAAARRSTGSPRRRTVVLQQPLQPGSNFSRGCGIQRGRLPALPMTARIAICHRAPAVGRGRGEIQGARI